MELALAGKYHVHGIIPDPSSVESVRQDIASSNLYGQVVANHSSLTNLPYADLLVNLLIVDDFIAQQEKGLTVEELMRALAPKSSILLGNAPANIEQIVSESGYGDAQIRQHDTWTQIIKPWPEGMDEWPQLSRDASGTSTSRDQLVQPPNSVQWVAGDLWRHESGSTRVISANGRIFSSYTDQRVVARDAFNGLVLWERNAESVWIATENLLFVQLEVGGNLVALDASTGATIREYPFGGTGSSWPPQLPVVYHDGILLTGGLEAYDAETGVKLWSSSITNEEYISESKLSQYRPINQKRIIADGKIFLTLLETTEFACLDLQTGEELWRVPSQGDRLVSYGQGVLLTQYSENNVTEVFNAAYSAQDGQFLWRHDYHRVWHGGHPYNVLFLDGLVWVLASVPQENIDYEDEPQEWRGLDLEDGQIVRRIDWENTKHYCFEDRATEQYIMAGGMDFLDVRTGEHHKFLGGKGGCRTGFLPANGLVYKPESTCNCYSQVRGFAAFSANASIADPQNEPDPIIERQFGEGEPAEEIPSPEDWPMLRRDSARSGSTTALLSRDLKSVWKTQIGARVSSPVIACGKVFVSSIDDHRVIALDVKTGDPIWSYTANGRVDSPPTIYNGKAIFGCRDGWVYCVSSATGELIWSLRAAPEKRWIISKGQTESAWPVFGSVLIEDGTAYFAAGRHSDVDGGVLLYAVSPETGEVLWRKWLNTNTLDPAWRLPGNISNDILVSNGQTVFLQKLGFDPATGVLSTDHDAFWSGTSGGFLSDHAQPIIEGWHELSQRQWRYTSPLSYHYDQKALIMTLTEQNLYGVLIVEGDSAYTYEVFGYDQNAADPANKFLWNTPIPEGMLPKAILHAGGTVYIAATEESDGSTHGAILIYDTTDGQALESIPLVGQPKFDGLAAIDGKLILINQNGEVICLTDSNGLGIDVSTTELNVPEGVTNSFNVSLTLQPDATTTVTVSRVVGGDTDLTVQSGASLTFTTNSWATSQMVTLSAGQDDDWANSSAVFRCSSPGIATVNVTATEIDDDTDPAYSLPFSEPFETLTARALADQHGWTGGGTVQGGTSRDTQALALTEDTASHLFVGAPTNIWVSFWVQGNASEVVPTVDADAVAALYISTNGNLVAYSNTTPVELTAEVSTGWNNVEVFVDYVSRVWKLSLNGTELFDNFEFYSDASAFRSIAFSEASTNTAYFDDINVTDSLDDTDGDGLPDWWEENYFGSTAPDSDNSASNGVNSVFETYIAGLNPTDPAALFEISRQGSELLWNAASGRVYTIYWASNLLSDFQPLETNNTGTYTDALHSTGTEGFYKINVRLAP